VSERPGRDADTTVLSTGVAQYLLWGVDIAAGPPLCELEASAQTETDPRWRACKTAIAQADGHAAVTATLP
jgi:hypothetical protein